MPPFEHGHGGHRGGGGGEQGCTGRREQGWPGGEGPEGGEGVLAGTPVLPGSPNGPRRRRGTIFKLKSSWRRSKNFSCQPQILEGEEGGGGVYGRSNTSPAANMRPPPEGPGEGTAVAGGDQMGDGRRAAQTRCVASSKGSWARESSVAKISAESGARAVTATPADVHTPAPLAPRQARTCTAAPGSRVTRAQCDVSPSETSASESLYRNSKRSPAAQPTTRISKSVAKASPELGVTVTWMGLGVVKVMVVESSSAVAPRSSSPPAEGVTRSSTCNGVGRAVGSMKGHGRGDWPPVK